jgi:hypothetical protein
VNFQEKLGILLILFIPLTGCLSGPLPEDVPKTAPPTSLPSLTFDDLNFIPFDMITVTDPAEDFADLTPEFEGLFEVPYLSSVDVVSNDLGVLSHPRRLQILASIESKFTRMYVEPREQTGTLIYFSIYKMNDSRSAMELLEAYKGNWNKRSLNLSEGVIWVWDGYIDEMAGSARPFGKDTILYWDPTSNSGFLSDKFLESHPVLTTPRSSLYSVHGETASGPFFIMIDVKTELQDIQNRSTSIFTQAAKNIFGGEPRIPEVPTPQINLTLEPAVNVSFKIESERLREDIRNLLESFLAGNISQEEYDSLFEQYTLELKNLANTS